MIPTGFKPLLAGTLTKPELIQFPVWASPKIDGIRCVIFGGVAYAGRSMKPIPNMHIQAWAKQHATWLEALDGELVVGAPDVPECMRNTMHGAMSEDGEPDFTFYAFDLIELETPYRARLEVLLHSAKSGPAGAIAANVQVIETFCLENMHDFDKYEAQKIDAGYEGMMIRNPDAPYKFGRSGELEGRGKKKRQGTLVKVKRFKDAEAVVTGFEEEMHNANEATKDAFGRTERSTHKANKHGKGILGKLIGRNAQGQIVKCSGFKKDQKIDFWASRHLLLGRHFTYKYFPHGEKDAPRHPNFKSFRAVEDMPQ